MNNINESEVRVMPRRMAAFYVLRFTRLLKGKRSALGAPRGGQESIPNDVSKRILLGVRVGRLAPRLPFCQCKNVPVQHFLFGIRNPVLPVRAARGVGRQLDGRVHEGHPLVAHHLQLRRQQPDVPVKVEHLLEQQAELARELDSVLITHPHDVQHQAAHLLLVHSHGGCGAVLRLSHHHLRLQVGDGLVHAAQIPSELGGVHVSLRGAHLHQRPRHQVVVP
mmetsp:Transcript_7851/g.19959  ORF Transcript_7851/g.19959 Transcript_7851/m.19959 type:complete len:222 (+) Transcript_7851:123-788(+)